VVVHTGPYPTIDLPGEPLHTYVLRDAAARGGHPALVDGVTGETVSYARLRELVGQLAGALRRAGLGRGDVLAVYAPNSVLFPAVCLAASWLGATICPVNVLDTPGELAGHVRHAGADHLVTISALLPKVTTADIGAASVLLLDRADGYTCLLDLAAGATEPAQAVLDPALEPALLPFSSGTSGPAKGVILTHRNITACIAQMAHAMRVEPRHRIMAVLPMFHVYGFTTLIGLTLRSGATMVVLPRFDLEQFLGVLARHRVTHALVAPPVMLALARHPLVDTVDLSALELVLSAGAPLVPALGEQVRQRTGARVVQAYGMTELSAGAHVPPPGATPPPGSVGKPLPNTECRIVSTMDGTDVAVGEIGELLVRGPQTMAGYLRDDDATQAVLDPAGWLRTGDLVRVDADGWFFVEGRVKELIKYKGYQVAPAELEAVLLTHPAIAEVAVVGVTDVDGTEVPKAFVVRSGTVGEQEVIEFVAARVAPYKKVRMVEFVAALPVSAGGKVLRRELDGTQRQVS
jgi:acyl-CoA synthetase (AMP-forming)/AMP-acid ligase II